MLCPPPGGNKLRVILQVQSIRLRILSYHGRPHLCSWPSIDLAHFILCVATQWLFKTTSFLVLSTLSESTGDITTRYQWMTWVKWNILPRNTTRQSPFENCTLKIKTDRSEQKNPKLGRVVHSLIGQPSRSPELEYTQTKTLLIRVNIEPKKGVLVSNGSMERMQTGRQGISVCEKVHIPAVCYRWEATKHLSNSNWHYWALSKWQLIIAQNTFYVLTPFSQQF